MSEYGQEDCPGSVWFAKMQICSGDGDYLKDTISSHWKAKPGTCSGCRSKRTEAMTPSWSKALVLMSSDLDVSLMKPRRILKYGRPLKSSLLYSASRCRQTATLFRIRFRRVVPPLCPAKSDFSDQRSPALHTVMPLPSHGCKMKPNIRKLTCHCILYLTHAAFHRESGNFDTLLLVAKHSCGICLED